MAPLAGDAAVPDAEHDLSPAQVAELLGQASRRYAPIRTAVRVALANGSITTFFAAVSILSGIFDPSGLVLGVGLVAVACNEFRGAGGLRSLKPAACRHLALGQLGLGAMLVLYGAWRIHATLTGPAASEAFASVPEAAQMMRGFDTLVKLAKVCLYVGVALGGVIGQGSCAIYYYTRRKSIQAYLSHTPAWVANLHRSGVLR